MFIIVINIVLELDYRVKEVIRYMWYLMEGYFNKCKNCGFVR